jgi:hypothetical protein
MLWVQTKHTAYCAGFSPFKGIPIEGRLDLLTERLHFEHFTVLGECSIYLPIFQAYCFLKEGLSKGRPPLVKEKSLSLNLKCSFKKTGILLHVCVYVY